MRCDRKCDGPTGSCQRCIKRHEESSCVYPPNTIFGDVVEGGASESHKMQEQLRVAELKAQIATLSAELEFQAASSASAPGRGAAATATGPLVPDLGSRIMFSLISEPSSPDDCRHLSDQVLGRAGDAAGDAAQVGKQLAVTLISEFHQTCWSQLPAFVFLHDALARFDYARPDYCLDDMDPLSQVSIVLLCALGASCKSRSGIFGKQVELHSSSLADIMDIGRKREAACLKLGDLAWEVAGRAGILWVPPDPSSVPCGTESAPIGSIVIGVLVGWSQWLAFADFMPVKSQWMLRNALSLYEDRLAGGHDVNVNDIRVLAGDAIMVRTFRLTPSSLRTIFHRKSTRKYPRGSFALPSSLPIWLASFSSRRRRRGAASCPPLQRPASSARSLLHTTSRKQTWSSPCRRCQGI